MQLIAECREWWKLWSIRLNGLGLFLMSWVQFDPVSALAVWNMMPGPVRTTLPAWLVASIGGFLFAFSMIARLVVQPKLEKNK